MARLEWEQRTHMLRVDGELAWPACGNSSRAAANAVLTDPANVTCDNCKATVTWQSAVIKAQSRVDRYPRYKSAEFCVHCGLSFSHWPGCPKGAN